MKDKNRDFEERWREKSRQMFDTSEARKAFQNVFDHQTSMAMLKLYEREVIDKLYGTIESGKESVVFLADTPEGRRVIVKIYMTQAGGFRNMKNYLRGDKRFRNFKDDRRSVIYEWCKKEFKNLKAAGELMKCPEPIAYQKNILVMEFIGEEFQPYPKMKEVEIDNPQEGYKQTVDRIEKLWIEGKLVHGDLSEYNILVDSKGNSIWIDFSQGVHFTHPEAEELLKRDIENVSKFFARQGAEVKPQKVYERIISSS